MSSEAGKLINLLTIKKDATDSARMVVVWSYIPDFAKKK